MRSTLLLTLMATVVVSTTYADQWPFADGDEYTLAQINITYFDVGNVHSDVGEIAKFGTGRVGTTAGLLVHVRSGNSSSHHGCELNYENELPVVPWIALVRRGRCNFDDKLEAAFLNNASGLVVYNNKEDGLQKMTLRNKYRDKLVSVFITRSKGEELAALTDNGTRIMMYITVGSHYTYRFTNINRTSVMFVSISFIVLMMISLAWLVFYYIQRFRYLHAKDRLSRELTSAAQKALSKIPTRNIKNSDKEVSEAECCAVCIEPYKASDVVRLLPCRHEFHKVCVDPWLLEHRTCPMCKMDILRHYGYIFTGSSESVVNMDLDAPIISGLRRNRPAAAATSNSNRHSAAPRPLSSIDVHDPTQQLPATEIAQPAPSSRRYWSWPRSMSSNATPRNTAPTVSVHPGGVTVETQVEVEEIESASPPTGDHTHRVNLQ